MLSQILTSQNQIASDIANIKTQFNARFDALESRVAALESVTAVCEGKTACEALRAEGASASKTLAQLSLKIDELENQSRRNNIILHGFPEDAGENGESILSSVSVLVTQKMKMEMPRVERIHRLGKPRERLARPIILKLLNFNDKMALLKKAKHLKGSDFSISEDYSFRVRSIRKKLWDATSTFRNNGSSVKIVYDHVFIDNVRYNWNDASNVLVVASGYHSRATNKPGTSPKVPSQGLSPPLNTSGSSSAPLVRGTQC